ncbi:Uncharacterised protein [Mycobacteroides abscessus subsp. abscessus]|nr:Uncharacterised protein [Mycobacteroides abscessus subsp. abscessus]
MQYTFPAAVSLSMLTVCCPMRWYVACSGLSAATIESAMVTLPRTTAESPVRSRAGGRTNSASAENRATRASTSRSSAAVA